MTDPEALGLDFDACFRELFARVARAAALVSRDADIGPDIAQEAFARLYERWERIESIEHARHFVFRVAVNLARSHLRRRAAAPFGLRGPERSEHDATGSSDAWILVADALGALSPRQRACVVLIDYVDLDAAGAATVLEMAQATVRVHLMRGRRSLRAALNLSDQEIEP